MKKLKAPSDREESINIPVSKATVGIHYQTSELKSSRHQYEAEQEDKQNAAKLANQTDVKYVVKLALFILVSLFLIYNAMSPAKRFNSRKIKK